MADKRFHGRFGMFMIVLTQFAIFFGIYSYCHNRDIPTVLHWIAIFTTTIIIFFLELSHRYFLSAPDIPFEKPTNYMDRKEFDDIANNTRKKLVLLDNLVLDVTHFAEYHPGGKFVLDKLNGRDISKYFYGGYSYEP